MELVAFPGARLDGSAKEVNLLLWAVFAVSRAARTIRVWDTVWGQSSMQSQRSAHALPGDACWECPLRCLVGRDMPAGNPGILQPGMRSSVRACTHHLT